MIRTLLCLPFRLLSSIVKALFKLAGFVCSLGFGTLKMVINRLFGTFFGALIGFFLGKNHIGIRIFKRKKKAAVK